MITIEPIRKEQAIDRYRIGGIVADERKYFSNFEVGPFEKIEKYVLDNIASHHLQFVALEGGKVVGFCELDPSPHPVHAHTASMDMALLPEVRGRGIGELLLRTVIEAGRKHGLSRIGLSVFADNERAIKLYKKCGFEEEGRLRGHCKIDDRTFDLIEMGLLL